MFLFVSSTQDILDQSLLNIQANSYVDVVMTTKTQRGTPFSNLFQTITSFSGPEEQKVGKALWETVTHNSKITSIFWLPAFSLFPTFIKGFCIGGC